jgi:hypothetical protein
LKVKLEENLGLGLGKFIFKELINCLFYQSCNFKPSKISTGLRLVLKPFINHLWVALTSINFQKLIQDYKEYSEHPIEVEINGIVQEKDELKSKAKDQPGYKENLKALNLKLAKKRRLKSKLLKQLETPEGIVCKIIESTLDILEQLHCKPNLLPVNEFKQKTNVKRTIT